MLEIMLKCDLSSFKDDKKEDFLINIGNLTFIGEIKGVTSNIKSEHISQLEVHYQGYMDIKSSESENVKAILIINHQRTQRLSERQEVHNTQIKLAERNGSLIIETSTLLRLFEAFIKKDFTVDQIINIFCKSQGLLKI